MSAYTPSSTALDAIKAVADAEEALKQRRQEQREALAAELRANPDATNAQVGAALGFTEEFMRRIAREFDIPRKRKPTVRSIKGPKRATK
ncbi:hypothetical protein [Streptomyces tendae]|uniref:hypothetical protein n=1 Tax=Streptomyces tendae TaxID=1932 RepID=UPI003422C139